MSLGFPKDDGLVATQKNDILSFRRRPEVSERRETPIQFFRIVAEGLAQVKTLSGFLPICASCKKIRDDSGYWKQIESYLSAHADVTFSQGICPDCAQKFYGDFIDVEEALKKK